MKYLFPTSIIRLTILLIIGFSNILTAQTLQWAKNLGGSGLDIGKSITTDANGYVYTTGRFQGYADFDPGSGVYNLVSGNNGGAPSQFISKLDPDGNFVWAKSIGDSATTEGLAIALDSLGNVFTTGYFEGKADFDPNVGVHILYATGIKSSYVLKLDSAGNFIWVAPLLASESIFPDDISVDKDGNVYTTGEFVDTVDFDPGLGIYNLTSTTFLDGYICKINSSGNLLWAYSFGTGVSTYDNGRQLSVDTIGNVYLTGQYIDSIDFDFGSGTFYVVSSTFVTSSYIVKLDSIGNLNWAYSLPLQTKDIKLDHSGHVYISGVFSGIVDFDPGPGVHTLNPSGTGSSFILKLDINGNYNWAKNFGGRLFAIDVDEQNNIYSTGYFDFTVDFDPGPATFNLTSGGYSDVFVSKLYADGTFGWARKFSNVNVDWGLSIATAKNGYVYSTGYYEGSMNFDPPGTYNITSNGWYDIFVAKHSQCETSSSFQAISSCDIYTSPSGNFTWSTSGTYSDTLMNISGCDSILTISLTIVPTPNTIISAMGSTTFCQGDSVMLSANPGLTNYQWYRRNYAIPGATAMNYMAKNGGRYSCIGQNTTLCSDTSNFIVVNVPCIPTGPNQERTISNNDIETLNFQIYPNPGTGIFKVQSPQGHLHVFNNLGKEILSVELNEEESILDISEFTDGIYFVMLVTNETKISYKIVMSR